jgi:hypothetical protein
MAAINSDVFIGVQFTGCLNCRRPASGHEYGLFFIGDSLFRRQNGFDLAICGLYQRLRCCLNCFFVAVIGHSDPIDLCSLLFQNSSYFGGLVVNKL